MIIRDFLLGSDNILGSDLGSDKCQTIMSYNILVEIIINIVHSLAINDEL